MSLRPRTCVRDIFSGNAVFTFAWMWPRFRATKLKPGLFLEESGIVPAAIYRSGHEIDSGFLEIDREEEVIIPRAFYSCFRGILNERVKNLSATHLYENDRFSFMVHDGFYKRAAELAPKSDSGIVELSRACRRH